jgi:hypothetical protein
VLGRLKIHPSLALSWKPSLELNEEVSIGVIDETVAAALEAAFEADRKRS